MIPHLSDTCIKILVDTRSSVALVAFFGKESIPEKTPAFDLGVVFNIQCAKATQTLLRN